MGKNTETFTIDVSHMTDEEHKKLLKKIKEYFENHKEDVYNKSSSAFWASSSVSK